MNYDVDFKDKSCNIKINQVASRKIMLHQDLSYRIHKRKGFRNFGILFFYILILI